LGKRKIVTRTCLKISVSGKNVIPAKAGIQKSAEALDSRFHGYDRKMKKNPHLTPLPRGERAG
jgi:hypothetical protein